MSEQETKAAESKAISRTSSQGAEPVDGLEVLSIAQVRHQVATIHNLMKEILQKDVHYGIIPGTPKPSLWKPGAEKIGCGVICAEYEPMAQECEEGDCELPHFFCACSK